MLALILLAAMSLSCASTVFAQTPAEGTPQVQAREPDATMLRYPDVSATDIVFVYAGDLWLVSREGGTAYPLASPPGGELFPKFSSDGQTIAFVGNYDGNSDLYTIAVTGGVPRRISHHPSLEFLCGWTPEGELLYFSNQLAGHPGHLQLFVVSAQGGLPTRLPVPYGANGAISPDGRWLAYTPTLRDFDTWKRYRGGAATDIWLFDLEELKSRRITDWEGNDSLPMWHADSLYYLSDAGDEHRLNIWRWDAAAQNHEQITHFDEYDVKWPSIGPGPAGQGEIVFQNGTHLYLLDLGTEQVQRVRVSVPGDRPTIRERRVDAGETIDWADISPTGKRAVFTARGDIWTAPAEKGSARNLTRTSGVHERFPVWSPDRQWIAYFSDAAAEYELYITQSDGKGETKQLTRGSATFYRVPTWSPDSARIAFFDKAGNIYVHTIEDGETKIIDTDPYAAWHPASWSHDSRWLAYCKMTGARLRSIWLYNVESDESHRVTSGRFRDAWPVFDRKGDYLFFMSNRDWDSVVISDADWAMVHADTYVLLAVPLRSDVESPWAPKSDEESWDDEQEGDTAEDDGAAEGEDADSEGAESDEADGDDEATDENGDGDEAEAKEEAEEEKPLEIDIEGFGQRAIKLPVDHGTFGQLAVNHEGKLLYLRYPRRGTDGDASLKIFDLKDEKKEEKTVLDGIEWLEISADGKKLLVWKNETAAIVDAAPSQKFDKPIRLKGLSVTIDPRAEWRQMFTDVWRLYRDMFYDANMHGVDWDAVRRRYQPMVEDCVSRSDLNFILGEMIGELNCSHAYVWEGGDTEDAPRLPVGLLGVDYELDSGAYRIARIVEGAPWDVDARNPLAEPGIDVKEGDYLLSVNGVPVDATQDPWAAFVGLAGETITLTVSDKPQLDDDARTVVVKALPSERELRYRAWIEKNRAYVEEATAGSVGYIYVPDTAFQGHNDLFRQFMGQIDKEALIVDERWNGGGFSPTRMIELLNRPVMLYRAQRDGKAAAVPYPAHFGPKCMLINGQAGSGGDNLAYQFRKAGVGKLIGTRTFGGQVGLGDSPQLLDDGWVRIPSSAMYETDGTWGVEGHGVEPDIEVVDDPALMVDGGDPQLDAAIEHMLAELERNPYTPPDRPASPDRSGMGITEEGK